MSTLVMKSRWHSDTLFQRACWSSAILIGVLLVSILLSLLHGAWPALEKFGFGFLFSTEWNPITSEYGAANALYGTLVSSFIAILLALPLSLAIGVFLTELAPAWMSHSVAAAIELLAAVPSIIYGMWGLFVFAPWFSEHFQLWALDAFSEVPVLGLLFSGPPMGVGLLTSGIILAFMILPILTALIKEALSTIPNVMREASYGIGANRWEVTFFVLLPAVRSAIFGAVILALGRALGETMAVTFVIGGAQDMNTSLFMPATSVSATIAEQFNEATNDMHISSLLALGLLLFVITFAVMAVARILMRKRKLS
ncbi:phosphate ABC transporter permease [Pokkaliibacter plantistimulans]|uniref:Phosphate transport system permease protein n=1 Tax=Pokkaliibacter plantistimulans TaxID=1635171 RepID=A0ABX5LRQ3_9GAMM|nr:phosphate ABC transporter permease subunit PstC [Pokkaliibacter plantistimulans]PXF28859.1 phosphate ABC transporter permease [Pokkaliibacter plantistimulans]